MFDTPRVSSVARRVLTLTAFSLLAAMPVQATENCSDGKPLVEWNPAPSEASEVLKFNLPCDTATREDVQYGDEPTSQYGDAQEADIDDDAIED